MRSNNYDPFKETFRKKRKKRDAEKARTSMKYRGLINIDFSYPNENEYQKLLAALIQTGWVYLETSALHFIEGDLPTVLQALDLIGRQCQDAGILSALTIHIQGSMDFRGTPYSGAKNHPSALSYVRSKPFPNSQPQQ